MPLALAIVATLATVGAVQAALPPKDAKFSFHDHDTSNLNWHVELRIDRADPKKIKTLVVYSQKCKATIAKTDVPISDAGVVAAAGGLKGGGTWEVNATFAAPTTLVGTMRMTRSDCDTGVLSYPNAITGDGHTDHSHKSSGAHDHGRQYPDFDTASPAQRRQARKMHQDVLQRWRGTTLGVANGRGFRRPRGRGLDGLMFHLYNTRYENDGRIFDAKRPESLVFWRRPGAEPVFLGIMFRVAPGKRPKFAGPIPIYHSHKSASGKVVNQMTHVWMVEGTRSAWTNCLPVWQLEQYNPDFKWSPDRERLHGGGPCT